MVIWLVIAGALLVLIAEFLHSRRVRRIGRLAFGPVGRARQWTKAIPFARAMAVAGVIWGSLVLLQIDGASTRRTETDEPPRHLVICLDVSPSMQIEDAGPDRASTRADRTTAVLSSMLERLDTTRTRVSVVAFYTDAKPVVIDTWDLHVVQNIIDGLPVDHAFEHGETDMYSGVSVVADIARDWPPDSMSMIVVSDGDTLPSAALPPIPQALADALVVGVGDPHRGRTIANRSSKQNRRELQRLALRLGGTYHDANEHHLPTEMILALGMTAPELENEPSHRLAALISVATGGSMLAMIAPALALVGAPDPARQHRRRVRSRLRPARATPSSMASPRPPRGLIT